MKWCYDLNDKRLVGAVLPVNSVGPQYQKINTDFIHSSTHVPNVPNVPNVPTLPYELRRKIPLLRKNCGSLWFVTLEKKLLGSSSAC
jgi:hypothetical protein